MTFTYPVIMTRREDGSWEGEFPDLEMCRCHGASLAEALEDARAQAYNWIDLELQEEHPVMPYVSDISRRTGLCSITGCMMAGMNKRAGRWDAGDKNL